MSYQLREKVFLLEHFVEEINGAKLPSNRQVLGHFLFLHQKKALQIRDSSRVTVERVVEIWMKASIPIRDKQNCITKLEKLFYQWKLIKKNKNRRTETQIKKEKEFVDCLENLFDISHEKSLDMMKNETDKMFLLAQRQPGRKGAMTSVDKVTQAQVKKKLYRQQQQKVMCEKRLQKHKMQETQGTNDDSSATDLSEDMMESDEDFQPPKYQSKNSASNIVNSQLCATLDRHKVTDRAALMIIGEAAKSLDVPISNIPLSRQSIRRRRQKCRQNQANNIKSQFQPDSFVIIHWDGKLMPDLTGDSKVDRLPVIATQGKKSQLLSVPKLTSGTGKEQAEAVIAAIEEWKLGNEVVGLCFDTITSNTGGVQGACVLLEQHFGRDLLHLACRHHILELIVSAAFQAVMGASSAPEVLLFKRFKNKWNNIDTSKYEDSSTDDFASSAVASSRLNLLEYLKSALNDKHPRDDYKELIELAIIYLGDKPDKGVRFSAPGAMHNARWMAKVLYCFKIWMFRS